MSLKIFNLIIPAAIASGMAVPANAVPLQFELSGSRSAVFQLDSNPVPDSSSSSFIGDQIIFRNVPGTFAGTPGTAGIISFGTGIIARLNVVTPGLGFTQFTGPELFSGGAAMPMFSTGTFDLTSIVSGRSTLVISEVLMQQVPEPGSLGLLLGGLGIAGLAMVKRRKLNAAV